MSRLEFRFQFAGPNGHAAAEEFERTLKVELEDWSTRIIEETPSDGGERVVDPVAVIILILAIPPATLSTWDLAKRIKLKPVADRLIAWAKDRVVRGEVNPVLALPEGPIVPLEYATPDQILNAIATQARPKTAAPPQP